MKKKVVLGITGGIGTGKSTVTRMLRKHGAEIIDADRIAHRLLQEAVVKNAIVKRLGNRCLRSEAAIDRTKLAKIVFSDKKALRALDTIMHPRIIRVIARTIRASRKRVLAVDAPLLIETNLTKGMDMVVVVVARPATQLARILAKGKLCRHDAIKRMRSQMPLKDKIRLADFVIDNNGSLSKTHAQVNALWKKVRVMQGGCSGKA